MSKKIFKLMDKVKWFGLRKLYWFLRRHLDKGRLTVNETSREIISIYDGYVGQNTGYNKSFLGFGLIHYAIIRNIKPKNILCIGSRKGFIPAILSLACKDNNFGRVDFVDAGYGEENQEKNWSGVGFWKKVDSKTHFDKIGIKDYIDTHVMTTKEYSRKFRKKRYQYVYIDGDHSYEGVKLDYKLFWSRLDKSGFMAFHDVIAKGYIDKGEFGVRKFWEELKSKNKIIFPFPKDSGLGILQK